MLEKCMCVCGNVVNFCMNRDKSRDFVRIWVFSRCDFVHVGGSGLWARLGG